MRNDDLNTYKEVLNSPKASYWRIAIDSEITSL